MIPIEVEIEHKLHVLIGLQLSIARRALDMLILHFGPFREIEITRGNRAGSKGKIGEYALHVQCPWRLESPDGVVTGRSDYYLSAETGDYFSPDDDTYYQFGKNLQDKKIGELLQGLDSETGSYMNITNRFFVEKVEADKFGGARIYLSGGYRLVLFPDDSKGENWRFFKGDSDERHFVVSGSHIERQ